MKHKRKRVPVLLTIVAVTLTALYWGASVSRVAAQGSWYAEYFSNRDLSGAPALTRYEENLSFDWGSGSPGAGVPADGFSARWTRDMWFDAGTYRFSYRSDDGIRIWVGDTLVVNDWRDREAAWTIVDHFVSRGTHRVRVEYYEHSGGAAMQAIWERVSGGAGWRGEYFGNRDLSGAPVLVRYDAAIDFDWKGSSPDNGVAVPVDNFSVRWTRTLGFSAGTYRFNTSSDDGVRVYVDGSRIVNAWGDGRLPNTHSGDITLGEGQHTIVVEYYEHGGEASVHVWWNRLGSFQGWEGRYFDNRDLRGGPALVRDDTEISFDWGEGPPAAWMPADNFSVVWTRQVNFSPGYYRLNARVDDGVRVWLDDGLVMDYWQAQDYAWHYVDGVYLEGVHRLKVEYFEQAGNARVRFWWEPSSTSPSPGPAPTAVPDSEPVSVALGPWQGEYFNNRGLSGTPVLVRRDAVIDFDWSWGAPAPQVNRSDFSARWSGTFHLAAGRYTFTTYSDDGVRLYVDGQSVIDSWRPMRGFRSGTVDLSEGSHTLRLEYFERTGRAHVRLSSQRVGVATLPAPTTAPVTRAGGPLKLDAWPVGTYCTAGGWTAKIFVEGHGGDGRYTYGWEGEIRGGPTSESMTFEVKSAGWDTALVGQAWVISGGQTVRVGLFVRHPKCS